MAIKLPHIEDSSLTHYIAPKGEFERFRDEEHYAEMVRYWKLSKKRIKYQFWYKGKTYQRQVKIVGYETYAGVEQDVHTLVVEFEDGNLTCIHPPYLKQMQSANFGKEIEEDEEESFELNTMWF